jgi:acyl carrier protein
MSYAPRNDQNEVRAARTTIQRQKELIGRLMLEKYEPIAIVGIGLRLPGGNETLDGFADFLRTGGCGINQIPEDRWDAAAYAPVGTEVMGRIRAMAGGFLDHIDRFDAKFFNIAPRDADYIDPQQRLVLETAWTALENANIDPASLRHSNGGVYVGASSIDYVFESDCLRDEDLSSHALFGMMHFALSGRVSYFLGWRGPSISVDTACSSTLVALHLAVEGLRRRECQIALCGGVNAIHHPRTMIMLTQAGVLSDDGRCKAFDDAADGYGRGEGCGMVVLKRLSDAARDGDDIIALVRGCAVREDGESAGLAAPNGNAQEALIRAALEASALEPKDIQYFEAHGTGTSLGDPIEMGAINEVFADSHSAEAPLFVGSLKTNIGHLEAAAGIGGVIKTALQLRDKSIYPHLNFQTPSRRIPWNKYPISVPMECQPWTGTPRRAVVNSLGVTGTIAAAVLEEAPSYQTVTAESSDDAYHVFTVSAKSHPSLLLQIERYQRYLTENKVPSVADICYTANTGRRHFGYRLAGAVRTRDELTALLSQHRLKLENGSENTIDVRKIAFLFAGSGSQYIGMGGALYRRYPVFRECVDECDELFAVHLGRSVQELMFGTASSPEEIHQVRYAHPALFCFEYALAKLWLSWGVQPNILIGHSVGELVAASFAGLFSLSDAVRVLVARSELIQSVRPHGAMMVVRTTERELTEQIASYPDLSIAAVNSPQQCVVSGGRNSLDKLADALHVRGVKVTPLRVSQAMHSPLMMEILDKFRESFEGIKFHEPAFTLISNVTGKVAKPRDVSTSEYWVEHLRHKVDFEAGIRTIDKRGRHAFVEIGPSTTLTTLATQCVVAKDHLWLGSTHSNDDGAAVARSVAAIYASGLPLSWQGFHAGRPRRKVVLPTYAFDRKRHWLPTTSGRRRGDATEPSSPSIGGADSIDLFELRNWPDAQREIAVGKVVKSQIAAQLGFEADEVADDAKFIELGLDSVSAVELINALREKFGIDLPASLTFDAPSVDLVVKFVYKQLAGTPDRIANHE